MSAQVSKESIALMMPNRLGHYFRDEPEFMTRPEVPRLDIFGAVWALLMWVVQTPRRRAVLDELNTLSEHELADIGLSRSEVTRIFDPSFAAERNAQRAAIAYARPAGA
ncbi:MAG: DUF1127 domain-containing protein [Alphaproteobacteria bacterium]|nr:DUF1127 domain-containing protein [Alphaproteobacteria bacterium]